NVVISGGPLPLACWSAKPIHIGERSLTRAANGRCCSSATRRGRPICWNIRRFEVTASSPLKSGEATKAPLSRLLRPSNQSTTSLVWPRTSLLVGEVRGARELEGDEAGEHRAEAHDDAVDGLRRRDEGANVELDVGQSGRCGHRQSHGRLSQ